MVAFTHPSHGSKYQKLFVFVFVSIQITFLNMLGTFFYSFYRKCKSNKQYRNTHTAKKLVPVLYFHRKKTSFRPLTTLSYNTQTYKQVLPCRATMTPN